MITNETHPDFDPFALPLPLTADTLASVARGYGGALHGDDANGVWDVEFPDVYRASTFAHAVADSWDAELRDPVRSLTARVVLLVSRKESR
jgi:hypothetical protein